MQHSKDYMNRQIKCVIDNIISWEKQCLHFNSSVNFNKVLIIKTFQKFYKINYSIDYKYITNQQTTTFGTALAFNGVKDYQTIAFTSFMLFGFTMIVYEFQ